MPPRDFRHNRAGRQRLFDDPHLIVARPATTTLNPAQNFYPHLPTLRLALKLDPRRTPATHQGGPPRRNTNVLTAARELQQVNNEIQSLENQATALINQARNLASLPYSSLAQLQQSIRQTQQLLTQAQRIAYSVSTIDQAFTQQSSLDYFICLSVRYGGFGTLWDTPGWAKIIPTRLFKQHLTH